MAYQFTVSPDFPPERISGWYIFNTWLQKRTGAAIHLELYGSFDAQRQAIGQDRVDLIYANPFDAAMLVRQKGFLPMVRAKGAADEAVVAVAAHSPVSAVEQLMVGSTIALTDDPDIRLMGMILLEPADLTASNTQTHVCDSYVLVAKQLIQGQADVGVFFADAFDGLSAITKNRLKVLVRSQISVIHHALMIGPKLSDQRGQLVGLLSQMADDDKGRGVLDSLGLAGWEPVDDEQMQFMIDLMDTLLI